MNTYRVMILAVCLIGGMAVAYPESGNTILAVNTGHIGDVKTLAFRENGNLLFSAGSDGTVKIWDTGERSIRSAIHVSSLAILSIIVSESAPVFSVLESNGSSLYRISTWNWEQQKQLYILELDEYPLFIGYSPKGSYLIYTETDWRSITILDSLSGRKLPYLNQGFGIVSHVTVSDTESTLIAYSPQGTITYWDIKKGEKKFTFRTLPNLKALSVNGTKRYLAAADMNRLLYIDLTKDNKFAQVPLPNVVRTQVHPDTGLIYCYSIDPSTSSAKMTVWEYASDKLIQRDTVPLLGLAQVFDLVLRRDTVYLSSDNGMIREVSTITKEFHDFPADNLAPVSGIGVSEDTVSISADRIMVRISTDFFNNSSSGMSVTYVNSINQPNPIQRLFSLKPLGPDNHLLWTVDDVPGDIYTYNVRTGLMQNIIPTMNFPIKSVNVFNSLIAVLESGGTCRVIDSVHRNSIFEYSSSGLQHSILASEKRMFLGMNSINQSVSSLLKIDLVTGETVPVRDSNVITFKLEFDTIFDRLFSLGIENNGRSTRTVLKVHRGPLYDNGTTIFAFNGEDLGASMIYDSVERTLYTTLGSDVVRVWNGSRLVTFEKTNHVPRSLVIHEHLLFAINSDKTVSVWNRETGRHQLDFYLYKDGSWITVFPDGTFYSPGTVAGNISLFRNGKKVQYDQVQRVIPDNINHEMDYYESY